MSSTPPPNLDLCNQALLRLGTRTDIADLAEGSPEALACVSLYTPCLNSLLATPQTPGQGEYLWQWARRTLPLSPTPCTSGPWKWQAPVPEDCVKIAWVSDETAQHDPSRALFQKQVQWGLNLAENSAGNLQRLLCFSPPLRHTHSRTAFTLSYVSNRLPLSMWPGAFVEAFTAHLAARLAVPLTGNDSLTQLMRQQADTLTWNACMADQSHKVLSGNYVPDWIAVREGFGWPASSENWREQTEENGEGSGQLPLLTGTAPLLIPVQSTPAPVGVAGLPPQHPEPLLPADPPDGRIGHGNTPDGAGFAIGLTPPGWERPNHRPEDGPVDDPNILHHPSPATGKAK